MGLHGDLREGRQFSESVVQVIQAGNSLFCKEPEWMNWHR